MTKRLERRVHRVFVFLGSTILWTVGLQGLVSFGVYYPEFIESVYNDGQVVSCILAVNQLMTSVTGTLNQDSLHLNSDMRR